MRKNKLTVLKEAATQYCMANFSRKLFEEDHKHEDQRLVKKAADAIYGQ